MENRNSCNWAFLSHKELIVKLNTSLNGLSSREAKKRLKIYSFNFVEKTKKNPALAILLNQGKNFLMLALFLAAVIAFFLGEKLDSLVIFFLIFISIILGFIQEYRAEKTAEQLSKYLIYQARVKRNNQWCKINASQLVPGDLLEVRVGDIVPADVRLIYTDDFSVNESVLTGESLPLPKTSNYQHKKNEGNTYANLAYMGSSVVSGLARGVVVATGKNTLLGKTASLLIEKEPETEFQKQTRKFSRFLFKIIFLMTVFVFLTNFLLNKGILDSFLFALALAVGITPELLPAIIIINLSSGALKIAQEKVIVKKLMAVEDLGNIDTLCTDKTGTLTWGELSLAGYENYQKEKEDNLLLKALLCTSGEKIEAKIIPNNPWDKALWKAKTAKKLAKKIKNYFLLDENEFDFKRRRMSVLVKEKKRNLLLVKGSVESMLNVCRLNFEEKNKIKEKVKKLERNGYRVIGLAEKEINKTITTAADEKELEFLGILSFYDPLKLSAIKAMKDLKKLGIKLKILSGDSPLVTSYISRKIGLKTPLKKIITGEELESFKKEVFVKKVKENDIFARITPEQKYQIISVLNQEGCVVGFLGDGVNDAPALKAADVGIAVDSGAPVAKEAADIILLKKDLQVLVEGIKVGRKTFGNIMKYIFNTISANFGNMLTVSLSSVFLKFIPMLPSQILLNNFLSDIPLLLLNTDNVDKNFLKKPKRWNLKTIGNFMFYFGLISSFFDLLTILPMTFIWKLPATVFWTAWFVESSLSEMLVTFSLRTKKPFYQSAPSKALLLASLFSILMVILIPLSFYGRKIMNFSLMPLYLWFWVGFIVSGYFLTTEICKYYFFKKYEV